MRWWTHRDVLVGLAIVLFGIAVAIFCAIGLFGCDAGPGVTDAGPDAVTNVIPRAEGCALLVTSTCYDACPLPAGPTCKRDSIATCNELVTGAGDDCSRVTEALAGPPCSLACEGEP